MGKFSSRYTLYHFFSEESSAIFLGIMKPGFWFSSYRSLLYYIVKVGLSNLSFMNFADTQFLSEHMLSSDFDQEFPSLDHLVTTSRDAADL